MSAHQVIVIMGLCWLNEFGLSNMDCYWAPIVYSPEYYSETEAGIELASILEILTMGK